MDRFVTNDQIANWFAYHPPKDDTIAYAHDRVRTEFRSLALSMNDVIPESPDKTVALRAIREAMYHCNAAIACAGSTGIADGGPSSS